MRILVITPGDGRDLRPWLETVAGVSWLIREPQLSPSRLAALVKLAPSRVWLHEKTPGAVQLAAAHSLPLHLASQTAPPSHPRWGRSCHSRAELEAAERSGASWTLLSPVWSPRSKPLDQRPTLGMKGFLDLALGRRCYALGGLTPARATALHQAGAYGIAVCGEIFRHPSPQDALHSWGLTSS